MAREKCIALLEQELKAMEEDFQRAKIKTKGSSGLRNTAKKGKFQFDDLSFSQEYFSQKNSAKASNGHFDDCVEQLSSELSAKHPGSSIKLTEQSFQPTSKDQINKTKSTKKVSTMHQQDVAKNHGLHFKDDEPTGLPLESRDHEKKILTAQRNAEYRKMLAEKEKKEREKILERSKSEKPMPVKSQYHLPLNQKYVEMLEQKRKEEEEYRKSNHFFPAHDTFVKSQKDSFEVMNEGNLPENDQSSIAQSAICPPVAASSNTYQDSAIKIEGTSDKGDLASRSEQAEEPKKPFALFQKILASYVGKPKKQKTESKESWCKQQSHKRNKLSLPDQTDEIKDEPFDVIDLYKDFMEEVMKQMTKLKLDHSFSPSVVEYYTMRERRQSASRKEQRECEVEFQKRAKLLEYLQLSEKRFTEKVETVLANRVNQSLKRKVITIAKQQHYFKSALALSEFSKPVGIHGLAAMMSDEDLTAKVQSICEESALNTEPVVKPKVNTTQKTGGGGEPVRDSDGNVIAARVSLNPSLLSGSEDPPEQLKRRKEQRIKAMKYHEELQKQVEEKKLAEKKRKDKEQMEEQLLAQQVEQDRIRLLKQYEQEQSDKINKEKEIRRKIAKQQENQAKMLQEKKYLAEEAQKKALKQNKRNKSSNSSMASNAAASAKESKYPYPTYSLAEILKASEKEIDESVPIMNTEEFMNLKPGEVMGKIAEIRRYVCEEQKKINAAEKEKTVKDKKRCL